ncbi:hypothetical protein KIN_28540 [Litoreibacter roseus]|uniref:Lysozyme inhibitor LprI-like N-terminal domain-containing protein n=2 Tax=Litoreibacter roseus TaxID=2601869 RepID=A0A6N6JIX6_9RHOB|nr:hypothetical protein KIN_28540 [Litoreibacter roseus]
MIGVSPANAESIDDLNVAEQDVRACFGDASVGETAPECLGSASGICQSHPQGQTTLGITACISAETAVWDAILNEQYGIAQQVFEARDPEISEALLKAQRAWITYRDAECGLSYTRWAGGTIRSIVHANCMMVFTAERAIELRDMRRNDR